MKLMIVVVVAAALAAMLLGGWSWHDSSRSGGATVSWTSSAGV